MSKRNRYIDDQLTEIHTLLHNARHIPDILTRLRRYGYDETRLENALTLCQTTADLHNRQKEEYGQQYAATDTFYGAWQEAQEDFNDHREFARILFAGNRELREILQLGEHTVDIFDEWYPLARGFYQNLIRNPVARTAFETNLSLPLVELNGYLNHVEALVPLNARQEEEKSEAQQATRTRDESLQQLRDFYRLFKAVAKRALRDNQRLEALLLGPVPWTS